MKIKIESVQTICKIGRLCWLYSEFLDCLQILSSLASSVGAVLYQNHIRFPLGIRNYELGRLVLSCCQAIRNTTPIITSHRANIVKFRTCQIRLNFSIRLILGGISFRQLPQKCYRTAVVYFRVAKKQDSHIQYLICFIFCFYIIYIIFYVI